jgi:Pyruvate/2-oxoacid:ferredoxin oxidoreductase delta subunit
MFGLPLIIKRFIESPPISNNTYNFAVATNGGTPYGTIKQFRQIFNARGIKLSGGFSVPMVNSCTSIREAIEEDKQQQCFEKAKAALNRICTKIEKQEHHMDKGIPGLNWYFSGVIHTKAESLIGDAAKYFYTDKNCNGCGICKKVCPVKNIVMDSGQPGWHSHCEQCYACLQWCPMKSIQVKNKKTEGRRRYHHPEVSIVDVANEFIL